MALVLMHNPHDKNGHINNSNIVVGAILEDTIVRSTKTQTSADGELCWLRTRLEAKRQAGSFSAGKLELEATAGTKHAPASEKENSRMGLCTGSGNAGTCVPKVWVWGARLRRDQYTVGWFGVPARMLEPTGFSTVGFYT